MKVYLDSTQLTDLPLGLDELEEILELDLELHTYVIKYEFPLTFVGDGFRYINDLKKQNGFCGKISITIEVPESQGINIIRGYFYLTDASFNHTSFECEVDIFDNTYGAFVSDATDLKASPLGATTRDGSALTPVTSVGITLFTPANGVNLGTDAKMFKIAEVFDHHVKYLSNNNLQTDIDYFTDTLNFVLSKHFYIRNRGADPDVQFSYKELASQMFKLWDFWFKIDANTSPFTLTAVQGEGNFFEDNPTITFSNIRDLVEEFYQERFFSTIDVGDQTAIIERGSTYQLPTVPLVGFSRETYNAANDCVIETKLELTSEWTIDTNRIEDMLLSDEYEEQPVLIYADVTAGVNDAYKGTYGKTGAMRYYNEELLNFKVLERHSIGTELSQSLGTSTDDFKAYLSADINYTASGAAAVLPFDDDTAPEGFDTGGNYDNVLYRYVAPSTGSYKFGVDLEYTVDGIQDDANFGLDGKVTLTIRFNRRQTGTGTLLASKEYDIVHLVPSGTTHLNAIRFAEFFCEATDYVEVTLQRTFLYAGADNSVTVYGVYLDPNNEYRGSNFNTAFIFNNGGTVDTGALKDYRASAFIFGDGDNKYPINNVIWNQIKADPTQAINLNNGGANIKSWVKKIARNITTGGSKCEMLSSPNLSTL